MSGKRLLLMTTDEDLSGMLQIYFEGEGYEITEAVVDFEGCLTARSWQPNIIIITSHGLETEVKNTCEELLNHSLTGHIPILLLLGALDRKTKLAALELGVDDIITYPYDIEELKLRAEAAIRLASHRQTM